MELIPENEKLRQQLISTHETRGNTMNTNDTNVNDVNPIEEAMQTPSTENAPEQNVQEHVDVVKEESKTPSLADIFAGASSVRLKVEPKVILTVCANQVPNLPASTVIGGEKFTLDSPLAKGGILREGLKKMFIYLRDLNQEKVVFFGVVEDLGAHVDNMQEAISEEITTRMLVNLKSDSIRVNAPEREEEEDDGFVGNELDNIGVSEISMTDVDERATIDIPVSDLVTINSWITLSEDQTTLHPIINVVVNMAVLVDSDDLTQQLKTLYGILANYSNAANMGDNFRLMFAFDSNDLIGEPVYAQMLADHNNGEEGIEASVISNEYFINCIESNGESDVHGLYPLDISFMEARDLIMPYGGDLLLIVDSYPRKEKKVKSLKAKRRKAA